MGLEGARLSRLSLRAFDPDPIPILRTSVDQGLVLGSRRDVAGRSERALGSARDERDERG